MESEPPADPQALLITPNTKRTHGRLLPLTCTLHLYPAGPLLFPDPCEALTLLLQVLVHYYSNIYVWLDSLKSFSI